MRYLFLVMLLVGCSVANNVPLTETYPIEEAAADEGWTRLERIISTGEAVTFLVPSTWFPSEMSDIGNIKVIVDRTSDSSNITIVQE